MQDSAQQKQVKEQIKSKSSLEFAETANQASTALTPPSEPNRQDPIVPASIKSNTPLNQQNIPLATMQMPTVRCASIVMTEEDDRQKMSQSITVPNLINRKVTKTPEPRNHNDEIGEAQKTK